MKKWFLWVGAAHDGSSTVHAVAYKAAELITFSKDSHGQELVEAMVDSNFE